MPTFFSVTCVTTPADSAAPASTLIQWKEAGVAHSALWRSERGALPPRRIVAADDTMAADDAYRLACEGTGLLWRGDFQNARQMVQALARRIDKPPKASKLARVALKKAADNAASGVPAGQDFHLHRQAQSQRARVLGMVLIEFAADYSIALRRAPDAKQACTEAWGPASTDETAGGSVASLRELMGVISAHEWRKRGVEIPALGKAPNNRIHPHYGVFSPVRGEYVDLVANAPLPASPGSKFVAFDIGTGTGVLSAVLAMRDEVDQVVATDLDPRALECARENIYRLRLPNPVKVMQADLFPPEGLASVIVCNPPWLPARPSSPLEGAVYDENSRMLLGFLNGLAAHLAPGGEGWLILSNFAEKLGLRSRAELMAAIKASGLQVLGRIDAKPEHPKATDASDPLHKARAAEVTSLWRLGAL